MELDRFLDEYNTDLDRAVRPLAGARYSLPKNFRVVHAAETSGGGIATYLSYLIAMQRERFGAGAVTVMLPRSQSHFLCLPQGVNVLTFDDSSGRIRNAFRLASLLVDFVIKARPAVVHLHSTFAGAVLRPMLRVRRQAKIIYCPHGWAFDRRMNGYVRQGIRWAERGLAKLCDAIICVSQHEIRTARASGIAASKLVLIRNGVPMTAPASDAEPAAVFWPPNKRRVLFVGRFDQQKGIDVLLGALSQLQDEVFACLVGGSVVGDFTLGELPRNVRLCGYLSSDHLEAYYRSADVVVIPSRWEGFGLVAAEAMRAGLPVIASDVGGLSEQIEDGVTGMLIPPDDEDALVDALRTLTRAQLSAMGKLGRERFLNHFTMERTHRELCDLYAALCFDDTARVTT